MAELLGKKSALTSKTIIGAIGAILAGVSQLAQVDFDAGEFTRIMADGWEGIIAVVGGAVAWYGRIKATQRIG